jgi:NAD(P)-dependent dehydrogenase (short-subunit alcohol dehydrogenase family)
MVNDAAMSEISELFQSMRPRYPELAGRVAIVTGAGKGIGKGIAARLAREGMKVVLTARTAADVEAAAADLQSLGAESLAVAGDIGEEAAVERLFEQTVRAYGRLDVLVNNAADLRRVPFFEVSAELFASELNTNVRGPFLCSQRAARLMLPQGRGSIVHISSVGGLRAHHPGLPYDATKGALDAMTRVMGIELIRHGIRVNAVAPGAIYTHIRAPLDSARMIDYASRIPENRLGMPAEIGAVVAFLASDEAGYIVGQTIYVDGGITAQLSPPQYQI